MKPFWTYRVRGNDGSYYVGHTDNLELRIAQHNEGVFSGYTSSRLPVELVWCSDFPTREEALSREVQIKKWSRAKKEALVKGDWDEIKKLARGYSRAPSTSSGRTGGEG
jgi:predicted GIY-YIG superfamily endonuclease